MISCKILNDTIEINSYITWIRTAVELLLWCNILRCNILRCNIWRCNIWRCNIWQCNILGYNILQCNILQYNILWFNILPYNILEEIAPEQKEEPWEPFIPEKPCPVLYGFHAKDEGKFWVSMVCIVLIH